MLILRDYQLEILNIMLNIESGSYLIQLPTGCGKTVIFTTFINQTNYKVLLLSHREELVYQPIKYISKPVGIEKGNITSNGENIISSCVPSMMKRLNKFAPDYFDVIITDECFPKGTVIDGKQIDKLQHGDIITSYNHVKKCIEKNKILNTFKSTPQSIVIVKLKNKKEIICTGNHPIYTKSGYKPARELNNNDEVYNVSNRNNKSYKKSNINMEKVKKTKNVLLKRMFKKILFKDIIRNNEQNKQKICIKKNDRKQSNEKSRNTKKSFKQIKRNWTLSKNKMWKWCWFNSTSTKFINSFKRVRTIFRICNTNKSIHSSTNEKRLSNLLQDRYSTSTIYDSNRNRWNFTLCNRKTKSRQKERNYFDWFRVESVEIQKQTSDGTFGGLCEDGYVYNIEVENNNNYFVNGVLVHNCHHSASKSYKQIYDYFKPKYHFGFTATPNRNDGIRLNDVFQKIIYKASLLDMIKKGYLCDIRCTRSFIDFDLTNVKKSGNDFKLDQLDQAMQDTSKAIAKIAIEKSVGQTLIFGVSVAHCEAIQKELPDSVLVTANTKNRDRIIKDFTNRKFKYLINCMIFTEGTDIPLVETLIIARPTLNESLYCLDLDTEILTNHGWKKYNTIDINNDKSASFNLTTSQIKYEDIKDYIIRDLENNENYISIQSNYIDIRVTNKHRMIYNTRRSKTGWRIDEANKLTNLKDGFIIPVSGQYNYKGINLLDDEIKFIAWVKTDGNINKLNNAITITQSVKNINYVNEIEEILINCGMKYNKIFNSGKTNFSEYREQYIFTISKGVPRGRDKHLKGWGYLEKYFTSDVLWNMDNNQFDLFLEVCNKADGSKHVPKDWIKRTIDITKGNKKLIEDLQIASITRGYKANINIFINNYGTEMYTIHIKKEYKKHLSSHFDNRPKFTNETFKNDKCWCVENETGTLITRRNGKVSIMGNCQMVGRGLRLYEGKTYLTIIDCVGVSSLPLITAPSLLGLKLKEQKETKKDEFENVSLFDLEDTIEKIEDNINTWKINYKTVNLWAKQVKYNLYNINFYQCANGDLTLKLPNQKLIRIKYPDELGKSNNGVDFQELIDKCFEWLQNNHSKTEYIWNLKIMKRWGSKPATDKQKELIKRIYGEIPIGLTKLEASQILNRRI